MTEPSPAPSAEDWPGLQSSPRPYAGQSQARFPDADTLRLPGTVSSGESRAELAAGRIARLAADHRPGERIGSKDDLRRLCDVSVGTFNEAIKLAVERGSISSRPGPGGGIFATDPSPLSRMNGWFRDAAAGGDDMLRESLEIRNALAPLLVSEVFARLSDDDLADFDGLLDDLHRSREARDVTGFIWAAWNVHERFASLGRSQLLDSLYVSIMDVGTSRLRTLLREAEAHGRHTVLYFDGLTRVIEEFVEALGTRDADGTVDALRRTDPTMVLRPDQPQQ